MTGSFEHYCKRSDDAEAALRNLALFGHLSGENRARMGWPNSVRIRALLLSGENLAAQMLAEQLTPTVVSPLTAVSDRIPKQRTPPAIETRARKSPHWGPLDARYQRIDTPYSGG